MTFAFLAAAAAQLAAPDDAALHASARERATAFAAALESGAALPHASPKIVLQTYFRPRYDRTDSDAAELRRGLTGCRRGEIWSYVYGLRTQLVSIRYHCASDSQPSRWPVLEQEIENGRIARAWLSTGPRQLERDRVAPRGRPPAPDSTLAADRAAVLATVAALQAGRPRLPHARPGLQLRHVDFIGRKPTTTVDAAFPRRVLAGCSVGTVTVEPRRWLGSRLAMVAFSCPATHKPHPEMVVMLELLDGRVNSLELEAGPPPPPMYAVPTRS
jgi:hypothetical protein